MKKFFLLFVLCNLFICILLSSCRENPVISPANSSDTVMQSESVSPGESGISKNESMSESELNSESESAQTGIPTTGASTSSKSLISAGNKSNNSSEISKPIPFLQNMPQNGGVATTSTPTFGWTASNGADYYILTIAEDSSFKHIVGEFKTGSQNSYQIKKALENNQIFYWRVKAVNSTGTTNSLNETMSFSTIYNINGIINDYLSQNTEKITEKPIESGEFYCPVYTNTWDYWFVKDGSTYHAFHLERPFTEAADYIDIGHAASTDLTNWKYYGAIVKAEKGKWDDIRIATGSTVKKDGIWYTFYTGHSSTEAGIGVSVSKDLYKWVKIGTRALISSRKKFTVAWNGSSVEANILADPYVYPEPVNGWYYMIVNAAISNSSQKYPGAILMLRSKDLLNWEGHKIIASTGSFVRMETPQIWMNQGIWYLYFGGVISRNIVKNSDINPKKMFLNGPDEVVSNYIYTSKSIDGVYNQQSWSNIELPDAKPFYICKILTNPSGKPVLLTSYWGLGKLSKPYTITYGANGTVKIS